MKINANELFKLKTEGWTPKALAERYGCSKSSIYKYLHRTRKKSRSTSRTVPKCHPDRLHEANGLCRTCYQHGRLHLKGDYDKIYYSKNIDKIKNRMKNHIKKTRRALMLHASYGLTPDQYDKMFDRQIGLCAICKTKLHRPHNSDGHRAAAVDHDHGPSKRVRGLTCHVCNRSRIGKNNLETAMTLVAYLSSEFDGRDL